MELSWHEINDSENDSPKGGNTFVIILQYKKRKKEACENNRKGNYSKMTTDWSSVYCLSWSKLKRRRS